MRKPSLKRFSRLQAGAAASLMLLGCADYLTGQDGEPRGPLNAVGLSRWAARIRRRSSSDRNTTLTAS